MELACFRFKNRCTQKLGSTNLTCSEIWDCLYNQMTGLLEIRIFDLITARQEVLERYCEMACLLDLLTIHVWLLH
jgi:hypothetical protein